MRFCELALTPIGLGKSAQVRETAERLYNELTAAGFDVLLDDRDERPGVMFADMELIGIPHRVTIGARRWVDLAGQCRAKRHSM